MPLEATGALPPSDDDRSPTVVAPHLFVKVCLGKAGAVCWQFARAHRALENTTWGNACALLPAEVLSRLLGVVSSLLSAAPAPSGHGASENGPAAKGCELLG